jgi:glycosyltransferase involved in cell wall biosynthesis
MRIAIFSEVYWPMVSGVAVTLPRLADALETRGHAVRVYTATYLHPAGAAPRPEVHQSPSSPFFLYPDVQWAFPRPGEIGRDLRAFAPDLVHLATEFAMGTAGLRAARQLRVPVIASAHTDYERYAARYGVAWVVEWGWPYLRWFYRQAGRVLAPSQFYEAHLNRRGVTNTGIWTRGVDRALFDPAHRSDAWRARFGAGPDDLVVTYVGRLAREKNLGLLLEAWAALGERRRGARLVFVGRGPMAEDIAARSLPGVHLAGLARDGELSAAYASGDAFVFPSTTETFGNSLLEAMASGLPCVTVGAGGILDFAEHGVNAWVARAESAESLTEGLANVLADAELRRRLSAGALATARARDWDEIFDRLVEEQYLPLIDGQRARRAA